MYTLLAWFSSPALATPTISDCGNVPGTLYDNLSCSALCVAQTSPYFGLTEIFCDTSRDHVAAGAAVDGNGNGYTTADTADAEYVVLGADGTFGAGGTNRFCCAITDDSYETWIVRLSGTERNDEYRFYGPSAAPGLHLKNPDPLLTHQVAGLIETLEGDDDLYGSPQADDYWEFLFGGDNDDDLYGSFGDDMLDGGDGADDLFGNAGADVLKGREGNDDLNGAAGNDILLGELGDDALSGGQDDDCMQPEPDWGSDTTADTVSDTNDDNTVIIPTDFTISDIILGNGNDGCTTSANAQAPFPECDTIVSEDVCTLAAAAWEDAHTPAEE